MRIISDFKDYYDGVAHSFFEKDCIYIRKESEISDNEKEIFKILNIYGEGYNRSASISLDYYNVFFCTLIFFCGKIYTIFHNSDFSKVFFNKEDFINFANKTSGRILPKWSLAVYKADFFFELSGKDTKVNQQFNSPIVVFTSYSRKSYCSKSRLIKDANLNDFSFASIIDPYTAFQEIYMFMNSIYRNDKDVVQIEDKYRIEQHGFDKNSFRKAPTKKLKK